MDYEKKYKEAIKKAKKDLDVCEQDCLVAKQIFRYFPELAMSEDEKIKKEIIEYVKNTPVAPEGHIEQRVLSRWLAWLEKQGEQNESDVKDYNSIDPHFAKPIDKVEPKFKVGDYVVGKYISGYISEVRDDCYLLDYQGFSIDKQDNYHLWTIADAKDGDILFHSDSASNGIFIFKELLKCGFSEKVICYCDYDSEDGFCLGEHHTCCWADAKILHPATKEQRDLLFQKMHEAGYEWDAEKKKLKEIEEEVNGEDYGIDSLYHAQRILEKTLGKVSGYQTDDGFLSHQCAITAVKKLYKQKTSEWSEEDEKMCQETIDWFEKKCFPYALESENPARESIKWLKSLKQRIGG